MAQKTKAKPKQIDLSAVEPTAIAGYWWRINDGDDKGKYLFNDSLGSIQKGYVDAFGEVHRYFYLSAGIINSYSQITLLPSKIIEFTKLSDGYTMLFNGTLQKAIQPQTKDNVDWNETFNEQKIKLNFSLDELANNKEEVNLWLEQIISCEFLTSVKTWNHLSLGDKGQIVCEFNQYEKSTQLSVDLIDRFYDRFSFEVLRFLLTTVKAYGLPIASQLTLKAPEL